MGEYRMEKDGTIQPLLGGPLKKEIKELEAENNKITLENVKLRSICGDHGIDLSSLDDPNDIYVPKVGIPL